MRSVFRSKVYSKANSSLSLWRVSLDDAQRKSLRIATISRALKVTKTYAIVTVSVTFALGLVGIPVGSILAISHPRLIGRLLDVGDFAVVVGSTLV
ncbi:hypothetical protein [Gloeobacter kilaueensis]|uniref:Uncharacterized protein n=1 Tax=Gloeobacter kilaueensis (strain ATCC BAA-2537 / CCAP 1431/1 / ULC 316 / JS1) TaxID=1183438 RepID=U5QS80_GLOK1|nr:hypothetical protein [Gloeobacter kilaueensis]AGY60560.1 hypothetical protein GKIL_4314 [Gloeobacter kilaueensis JS1]